jgi:hypothetical protein
MSAGRARDVVRMPLGERVAELPPAMIRARQSLNGLLDRLARLRARGRPAECCWRRGGVPWPEQRRGNGAALRKHLLEH